MTIFYRQTILFGLLVMSLALTAQPYVKTRTITKSFKVMDDTELFVKNKYGRIHLIPWEKDSVKFTIEIEVKGKKASKVNSFFATVDVDFIDSRHYIQAETSFAGKGSFWTDVKDVSRSTFSSENKAKIDYKIYLPAGLFVSLENKYGDIFVEQHDGSISINLSNGDLRCHAFNGELTLEMEFAYANIKHINKGVMKLGYHSEVQLIEAENLKIESRSSRVKINKATTLRITSSRDKYFLDNVNTLNMTASYSYLEIGSLAKSINMKAHYGSVEIKKIEPGVSDFILKVESADLAIAKAPDQLFNVEVIYDERAGLFFSETLQNKITTKEEDKEPLVKTVGVLGTKSQTKAIDLHITLISGDVRIDTK